MYVNRRAGATTGAWPGIQPFGGWKGSTATGKSGGGFYYVQQFLREQSPDDRRLTVDQRRPIRRALGIGAVLRRHGRANGLAISPTRSDRSERWPLEPSRCVGVVPGELVAHQALDRPTSWTCRLPVVIRLVGGEPSTRSGGPVATWTTGSSRTAVVRGPPLRIRPRRPGRTSDSECHRRRCRGWNAPPCGYAFRISPDTSLRWRCRGPRHGDGPLVRRRAVDASSRLRASRGPRRHGPRRRTSQRTPGSAMPWAGSSATHPHVSGTGRDHDGGVRLGNFMLQDRPPTQRDPRVIRRRPATTLTMARSAIAVGPEIADHRSCQPWALGPAKLAHLSTVHSFYASGGSQRDASAPTRHRRATRPVPDLITEVPGPKARAHVEFDQSGPRPACRARTRSCRCAARAAVEDIDGNLFLDFAAGIAVNSTGHAHPPSWRPSRSRRAS